MWYTAAAAAPAVESAPVEEIIDDSQTPEGGPFLSLEDTYGALADNEHEENESMDEETQQDQVPVGQSAASAEGKRCKIYI